MQASPCTRICEQAKAAQARLVLRELTLTIMNCQLVHVIGCNSGTDITQVKFPQSNSYYKRGNVLHSKLHKHYHMISN